MSRVVITGMGIISPIGIRPSGIDELHKLNQATFVALPPRPRTELTDNEISVLTRVVRAIVKNEHDAEDIVQDVRCSVFFNGEDLDQKECPLAWLITVAKHKCIDHLRRRRRNRTVCLDHADGVECQIIRELISVEDSDYLEAIEKKLSGQLRAFLVALIEAQFDRDGAILRLGRDPKSNKDRAYFRKMLQRLIAWISQDNPDDDPDGRCGDEGRNGDGHRNDDDRLADIGLLLVLAELHEASYRSDEEEQDDAFFMYGEFPNLDDLGTTTVTCTFSLLSYEDVSACCSGAGSSLCCVFSVTQ